MILTILIYHFLWLPTTRAARSYSDFDILEHPRNQSIPQGQSVTLNCLFKSRVEECLWQLDGLLINVKSYDDYTLSSEYSNNGNCSLIIKNVNLTRDEGSWRCLIARTPNHPKGALSEEAFLEVVVFPSVPFLIYFGQEVANNSAIKIDKEKSIPFLCETKMGNPATKLSWKIGDNKTREGITTVTIEEAMPKLKRTSNVLNLYVRYEMDSEFITCLSEHYNEKQLVRFKLDVSYATTYVKIISRLYITAPKGKYINFSCIANGNPPPKFEWKFKPPYGKEWTTIDHRPNFSKIATETMEGQYLCIAGNDQGPRMWSLEMTVTVSDKMTKLVNTVVVPIVCTFILLVLILTGLIIYLRRRQKKKSKAVNEMNLETLSTQKTSLPTSPKTKSKVDRDGYLLTRPLPEVQEQDQYVTYDPQVINNCEENRNASPKGDRSSNIYEDINEMQHVYENTSFKE